MVITSTLDVYTCYLRRYGFGKSSDHDSAHIMSLAFAELFYCALGAMLYPFHFFVGVWRRVRVDVL